MPETAIILASASPRRQALMRQAGIPCLVRPSDIDEIAEGESSPFELVKIISAKKAMHALRSIDDHAVIIAADTIVCIHGRVLGKPKTQQDARDMLHSLQGAQHSVYTGVTLIKTEEDGYSLKHIVDTATVYMRTLTEAEIDAYIATGEPFDKAGAYGIQEKGSLLIERIDGDYHTVVGLPMTKLYLALKMWGIDVTRHWAQP